MTQTSTKLKSAGAPSAGLNTAMLPETGTKQEFKRAVLSTVKVQCCTGCHHPRPLSLDDLFWEQINNVEIGVLMWCEHCSTYDFPHISITTVDVCGTRRAA